MSTGRSVVAWLTSSVWSILARCYPRSFREEAAFVKLELQACLRDAQERGLGVLVLTSARELLDLVRNLGPEWVSALATEPSDAEGGRTMSWDGIIQDLRVAVRGLRRRPGFTAVIVITMTVAIGGSTAVFGVVNSVLLRPLPYPEADRLVYLYESFRETQVKSLSYPNYLDWRNDNQVFEDLAARASWSFTLTGRGDARVVPGMLLTANTLDVLGVEPELGRMFTASESESRERLVLISHGLWQESFGGSGDALGRSLTLDGEPHTIIGVLPRGLEFPLAEATVWAPITRLSDSDLSNRGSHPGIGAVGRLRPELSLADARRDMRRVTTALAAEYPETNSQAGAGLNLVLDTYVAGSRQTLYLLLGAVGLVLLIACANVANLLLVRSGERHGEAAVRAAMGASRSRIARLLLGESLLLGLAGGTGGLVLAAWLLHLARVLQPGGIPRLATASLDGRVLLFASALSVGTAVLFGLAPALRLSSANPGPALKSVPDPRRISGGTARRGLVVFEVAAAFVLLFGAGLMIRSVEGLLEADAGIATDQRLTFRASLPSTEYSTLEDRVGFYTRFLERMKALPGVVSVAGVDPLPLSRSNRQMAVSDEGFPQLDENGLRVDVANITPDYFETVGMSLVAGVTFDRQTADQPVVIADELLAETLWPGKDAVGRQLRMRGTDGPWMTVVGVAPRVSHYGVQWDSRAKLYFPYSARVRSLSFVIRTEQDPLGLVEPVRGILSQLDPDVALTRVSTLGDLRARTIAREALSMEVLQIFGVVALALALLGLYGVLAHSVASRSREIAIRITLGALPRTLLGRVLGESLTLTGVGIGAGVVGALMAARLLESLLFGIGAVDAPTLAAVVLVLVTVALVSAALPAVRALRLDPGLTLRGE